MMNGDILLHMRQYIYKLLMNFSTVISLGKIQSMKLRPVSASIGLWIDIDSWVWRNA